MKTKIILTAVLTGFILIGTNNLNAQKTFDNTPFSIIQVVKSKTQNEITIVWNDTRFEEIEIQNQNGLFMPSFPILNAHQLHLNDLEDGDYVVLFKKQNEVIATKEFNVTQNTDMAQN